MTMIYLGFFVGWFLGVFGGGLFIFLKSPKGVLTFVRKVSEPNNFNYEFQIKLW